MFSAADDGKELLDVIQSSLDCIEHLLSRLRFLERDVSDKVARQPQNDLYGEAAQRVDDLIRHALTYLEDAAHVVEVVLD